MKKIIGILRPFDMVKTLYVYENGNKIDMVTAPIEELDEAILTLCQKYEISQVDLTGPKKYTEGIKNKVEQVNVTKYNANNITINLI